MNIKGVTDLTVTSIVVRKIVDHLTTIEDNVVIIVMLIIKIPGRNEVETMRKSHAMKINVKRRATRKIIIIVMIIEGIELVNRETTETDVETEKENESVVILGTKDQRIDIGKKDLATIRKRIVRDQDPGREIGLRYPSER